MAADPRQEVEFSLNGKTFRARPTFQILTSIEAALNQPARALGIKALMAGVALNDPNRAPGIQEISLAEMAVVLFWMAKDQPDAPKSPSDMGDILMDEGYIQHCLSVGDFLMRANRGNKHHLKEVQRQAQKDPDQGSMSPSSTQSPG